MCVLWGTVIEPALNRKKPRPLTPDPSKSWRRAACLNLAAPPGTSGTSGSRRRRGGWLPALPAALRSPLGACPNAGPEQSPTPLLPLLLLPLRALKSHGCAAAVTVRNLGSLRGVGGGTRFTPLYWLNPPQKASALGTNMTRCCCDFAWRPFCMSASPNANSLTFLAAVCTSPSCQHFAAPLCSTHNLLLVGPDGSPETSLACPVQGCTVRGVVVVPQQGAQGFEFFFFFSSSHPFQWSSGGGVWYIPTCGKTLLFARVCA